MSFIVSTFFIGFRVGVEELEELDVDGDVLGNVLVELLAEFEVLGLVESIMLGARLVELLDSLALGGVIILQELNKASPKVINRDCFFI